MNPGEKEGSRTRVRPSRRVTDYVKEAVRMSLQEMSRAVRTGHCGHHSCIGRPGVIAIQQHITHTLVCPLLLKQVRTSKIVLYYRSDLDNISS